MGRAKGIMNILVNRETWDYMCPKCGAKSTLNDDTDIECTECGYIYYMFSDKDNGFQMELLNEMS